MSAQPSFPLGSPRQRSRSRSPRRPPLALVTSPPDSAAIVGLRYAADSTPGIVRRRVGKGFSYVGPDGRVVRDSATVRRIQALAIPPAWTNVWISTHPNGHVQATGRDAKGRKQYRYHPRWRETRDETKFHRMLGFAAAMPRIRARVDADLGLSGLPREKVLATVVRLLETTLIRVGNEEYARANGHFGLTTLRDRHVQVRGASIAFRFRGKSGVARAIDIRDRRLASIVRKCQDLPGHELFQYMSEDGAPIGIESGDVNDYLRDVSGEEFTAKDFRTWAATVLAAEALGELAVFETKAQAKRNVAEAIRRVSQRLGNTPTVCRKCYVHPAILDGYAEGTLLSALAKHRSLANRGGKPSSNPYALRAEETAVVAFLGRANL